LIWVNAPSVGAMESLSEISSFGTRRDMPMSAELRTFQKQSDHRSAEEGSWAIFCGCAIALLMSLYFVIRSTPLDQIPALIAASPW